MTDDRIDPTADDGELLSAYLAGELDDPTAAGLERRLADEPRLAAQLDALADALVMLGGFDHAQTPDGFDERLATRLTQATSVADLDEHRRRKAAPTQWLRIGTVAAVLALGAVMAGTMLRGDNLQVAGQDSAEMSGSESAAMDTAALESGASRPSAPVLLDDDVEVAGEDALRSRYETVPEVQGLLGVSRDEAEELAMVFGDAISGHSLADTSEESAAAGGAADSDVLSSGDDAGSTGDGATGEEAEAPAPEAAQAPEAATDASADSRAAAGDACLAAITKDAGAPLVPVRVETLRYDGQPAIAYVLVTATPDSETLDRTEVWVVRPTDCATIVFQQY
jgi:hypothetical protein